MPYVAAAMILVLAFLFADVARSWFTNRETFLGTWSKTRVVDADSADALAIRP